MRKISAAQIAIMAALCALLSGCSLGGSENKKPISVSYSAMFTPKSAPETENETVTGHANAAPAAESAESKQAAEETPAVKVPAPSPSSGNSSDSGKTATKTKTAEAQSPSATAQSSTQAPASTPAGSTPQKAARAGENTSSTASEYTEPIRMPTGANATGKDPAAVALGGICYLPYKVPEPAVEESKPSTDSGTESDNTSQTAPKPPKVPTKYDYGYRVVFRTSSETYLMGITPYKNCTWDKLNSVCAEIGEKLETDCEIVGAPSLEDLKMFTEAGIYFPEKHEFWTSTLTAENGYRAYYRSKNGTFYSTKSTSMTSGACVIIKVKTSQSNSELLSNSQPNFAELKAQLEKEAEAYKKSQSES